MALYFITYDLITRKDYPTLWNALRKSGAQRVLLSVYVISLENTSAAKVRDYFKQFIDGDDRILIIEQEDWASRNALIDVNSI